VREAGVITSQAVLIAIGIDWDGRRQVLAVELANRESRSSWRPVRQRAAGLGDRCVEEVGPDSGRRVHPEQQNKHRRHKRAAAYSGQSDEHADNEAGHD
jgi:hypothetical protein